MAAADDFPSIAAAVETLTNVGSPSLLARELAAVLAEVDQLRSRHGVAVRIEALRDRARAAEQLVHDCERAMRPAAPAERRQKVLAQIEVWRAGERVA